MSWLDVRSAIDAAIETLESLAAVTDDHARRADEIGSHIATLFDGSNNDLPRTAQDHSASAANRSSDSAAGYRYAAQLCRDYLAAVDPAGAAGSVTGIGTPVAVGQLKGGHGPSGARPARKAVTDVSRDRSHVFPEQGPKGLADLTTRDDGIVKLRSEWMDAGGHARLRHGGVVTEQQLKDRAMHGVDPANGSTTDWESGRPHRAPRHATAFTSDAAMVFAEASAWNSKEGRAAIADAEANDVFVVKLERPAQDVFGPNFRQHVHGQTRVGSVRNPQGTVPTQFGDDTRIVTLYMRADTDAPWTAYTTYPEA